MSIFSIPFSPFLNILWLEGGRCIRTSCLAIPPSSVPRARDTQRKGTPLPPPDLQVFGANWEAGECKNK